MSAAEGVLAEVERQRVIPVLRTRDREDAVATARACGRGGMRVVELTYSIPGVEEALRELAGNHDFIVGMGTVTTASQVQSSVALGARFLVSYGFDHEVVASAVELGVPIVPGALTPSEVAGCLRAGAAAVKLFPARLIEPAYLGDLAAVMPGTKAHRHRWHPVYAGQHPTLARRRGDRRRGGQRIGHGSHRRGRGRRGTRARPGPDRS